MIFGKTSLSIRLELEGRVLYHISQDEITDLITIGRDPENTWQVPHEDRLTHGKHAWIEKKKNKLILVNKGENGIYFQGRKIRDRLVLQPGKIYGIGDCKLVVDRMMQSRQKHEDGTKYHRLEQLTGEDKGKIFELGKPQTEVGKNGTVAIDRKELTIGSAEDADIRINDSLISHHHALIQLKDDGCWIYDGCITDGKVKTSRNGTKVNQIPVSPIGGNGRLLQDGNIISIAYVDLRFWDKNVAHVRSHLFLKVAVVFMTIAIVVGGYFTVLSMLPSAKKYRIEAEKYAAAENFAQAEKMIELSISARGADGDSVQRKEFLRKLKIWKKTAEQWARIHRMLVQEKGQNWGRINSMFSELIYTGNENWKWNSSSAPQKMKIAQNAHDLIAAMLTADDFLRSSSSDFKYLGRILQQLSGSHDAALKAQVKFPALLAASESILKELKQMQDDYRSAAAAMAAYKSADKAEDIYNRINGIRKENAERVTQLSKRGLAASSAVMQYCDDMLVPLALLRKTEALLQKNYEVLAQMNFELFSDALTLPTARQAMVAKNLADRSSEMQATCERQKLILRQLKYFKIRFASEQFSEGALPDILVQLFDDANLQKVLSCDSLNFRQPGFQEKKPSGAYDATLGIYVFYEYLNSLNAEFDTSIFDDRFRPALFRATEVFDLLNAYLNFCHAGKNSPLAGDLAVIREIPSGNRVMALAENAEKTLTRKKRLIRKLMQTALSKPGDRKGIIAGGMVCWLKDSSTGFVPDDFQEQVYRNHRNLRRKLGALRDRSAQLTPEERKAAERKIFTLGIPGDPLLRQAWNDRFPKK